MALSLFFLLAFMQHFENEYTICIYLCVNIIRQ